MAIAFDYNRERARAAALWLLHRHGGCLNKLKLVKLVFLADREHLARHRRPIVGGRYVAMPLGPVASDLLADLDRPGADKPFRLSPTAPHAIEAAAPVNEDVLSGSDIEALSDIDARFGGMDQFTLSELTHGFLAWKNNYRGGRSSYPLPYEDFFLDLPEDRRLALELIREDQDAWALLS